MMQEESDPRVELVCPAGTLPALRAAVDHGADAVYIGFRGETNARNFPGLNFSTEEAATGIAYARERRARVFIALNVYPMPGSWDRQQLIGRNRVIMRWLAQRGGALDFRDWRRAHPNQPFPVVVALGADPALLIAATAPIPDSVSEFQFAGLLRRRRSEVYRTGVGLDAPASAEIVMEGHIAPGDEALEGPFGDHTGYYNSQGQFPVLTVERMTLRRGAFYHGGYMGRSPWDEPSVLAMSLNEMFVPMLKRSFPEIVDFYLPPEACSYRLAVVSIRKSYPGHARQIMQAVWSYLRQFLYTKFVIVTDDDIDVRNWHEVIWAIATRVDPARDTHLVRRTPIDYLDFAAPTAGLGSKLGIDATNKWPGETRRQWGRPLVMNADVIHRADAMWELLQIGRVALDQDQHRRAPRRF